MPYQIEYTYTTSSTFEDPSTEVGRFDVVFQTIEDASAALQRMKEHYYWASGERSAYKEDQKPEPTWLLSHPDQYGDSKKSVFNVLDSQGNTVWLWSSEYVGYFERLIGARVAIARGETSCPTEFVVS